MYFNDWLSRRRLWTPERIAVVDDDTRRSYSYSELDRRATRLARYLQECQVVPGDRVACLSTNRIEYIDLYFACGKVGAILVPLNFRLPAAALLELLADCDAGLLVYGPEFGETAAAALRSRAVRALCPIETAPNQSVSVRTILASTAEPRLEVHAASESDTAMILYTSGTTGQPKGAMIPWRQIHWNALNTTISLQLTQEDTAFVNMPLYHTGAWHVLLTPLMLIGGRVVLQPRFDPERCNSLVGPEAITVLFGVPTTLRMMREAANFSAADFRSVRFAIFGGESCPLPLIEAYAERGVAMRQGYGLTEAGPNCFSLPADDAIRKQGSIGFPNFHVGTRLRMESGDEAPVGEVGELLMCGPHVFSGYWKNPTETAEVLRNGWLATGDLMVRDEDGYYSVVGRKKDMYVSGGENVYPAQVERVLQSHAAVSLAAVVGVPHPKWGETGCAFVSRHASGEVDAHELLQWCRKQLARFQCPSYFVVLDQLPMGHSGKVDKVQLAERALQEFNDA